MKIIDFPRLRQFQTNDCGIAAIAGVLAYYGINERENQLIEMANLTSDGLAAVDVTGLLDRFGMNIDAGVLSLDDIRGAVDDNYPTILAIQAYADEPDTVYTDDWADGHYVVAIGYDDERLIFQDSSCYEHTFLTFLELLDRWHDSDSGEQLRNWGCITKGTPAFSSDAVVHME